MYIQYSNRETKGKRRGTKTEKQKKNKEEEILALIVDVVVCCSFVFVFVVDDVVAGVGYGLLG